MLIASACVFSHSSVHLLQTVEEIAEIVRQAQNPPAGPAGWDQDEYIGACPQPVCTGIAESRSYQGDANGATNAHCAGCVMCR